MSKELHDEIMNIACRREDASFLNQASRLLYKEGHRDARHDAAALALAAAPQVVADERQDRVFLAELLARIHRDGGHRQNDVGTEQAFREADAIVANWLAAAPVQASNPVEFDGIKTAPVQAQEPVLVQAFEESGNDRESGAWFDIAASEAKSYADEGYKVRKLFTAPVQAQEPRKPTDISNRLRETIVKGAHPDHKADILAAAGEIERYYGGMMNWKATAEAKDRAPVQPVAVPDGWRDAVLESAVQAIVERAGKWQTIAVINAFDAIRSLKKNRHALPESCSSFAAPAAQGDAIEGELAKIVGSGAECDFPAFLEWIGHRLVLVHKENPNVDYVTTLFTRAKQLRAAIAAKAAS